MILKRNKKKNCCRNILCAALHWGLPEGRPAHNHPWSPPTGGASWIHRISFEFSLSFLEIFHRISTEYHLNSLEKIKMQNRDQDISIWTCNRCWQRTRWQCRWMQSSITGQLLVTANLDHCDCDGNNIHDYTVCWWWYWQQTHSWSFTFSLSIAMSLPNQHHHHHCDQNLNQGVKCDDQRGQCWKLSSLDQTACTGHHCHHHHGQLVIIIASKNLHDIHLSDVIAKHPWYEELARDSQRPREHRIGNAGHY